MLNVLFAFTVNRNFGFNLACPEDSRIRSFYNGLEYGALPSGPSYIQDHRQAMDLCQNPEWQYMHGFTAWQGPRPKKLEPLFSFSKTSMHNDLLCVPLEQFDNTPTKDPVWEDKKFSKIIWRGSMTGVWFDRVSWWRNSQRTRLHFLSQAETGSRFVRFIDSIKGGKGGGNNNEVIREEEVPLEVLNERYLDAGYVGELHQCTEDDGGCEAIPEQIETVKGMDWESQNEYKYIVDTDGNAWSGRFHRLMASNSLVLKSTVRSFLVPYCARNTDPSVTRCPSRSSLNGTRIGSCLGCSKSDVYSYKQSANPVLSW